MTSKRKPYKTYPREFKIEAVRLLNTYLYTNANSLSYIDSNGLVSVIMDFDDILGSILSDELFGGGPLPDPVDIFGEATGYASERRKCESYMSCNVRCVGKVLVAEAITQGTERALKKAAKKLAAKKAAEFIAGVGSVSTAISGMQAVHCTWKCVKK